MAADLAPEWSVSQWFNVEGPLTLAELRGKVVFIHAFQMLCPGCAREGTPQAMRVSEAFAGMPLVVLGIHTVFEHHEAMKPVSLKAFLHEYRIRFPVAVDASGETGDGIPKTMRAYGMQGTPTTILIDAEGRLRQHSFGGIPDLNLGAAIQTLLLETPRI
jgi:peroxiredoxin